MGIGDELMAAGQARQLQEMDLRLRKVQITDLFGEPRWHELWAGNPSIAQPGERGDFLKLVNEHNARPYIEGKTPGHWIWKEFTPVPSRIPFTGAERDFGAKHADLVIVQPTIRAKSSPNRQWGTGRWKDVAQRAAAAGIQLVQLGPAGTVPLCGARLIVTASFSHACAILSRARAYVGHEGGMHHAAAALGIPAVVIFGAFISPQSTGYASHRNIFTGQGLGCGMRGPCACCSDAMARISPSKVLSELQELL